MSDCSCRHCVSAAGFGGDGLGPEENTLSHKTCYGCKTNGHQKKSVRRHTSNFTLVKDMRKNKSISLKMCRTGSFISLLN